MFKKTRFIVHHIEASGKLTTYKIKDKEKISDSSVTVSVNGNDKTFNFINNNVTYNKKGIPTIITGGDNAKAFDKTTLDKKPSMTASQLNSAVENNIIQDLLKAGKEDNHQKIILGVLFAMMIGLMFVGYQVYEMFDVIKEQSDIINEIQSNQDTSSEMNNGALED